LEHWREMNQVKDSPVGAAEAEPAAPEPSRVDYQTAMMLLALTKGNPLLAIVHAVSLQRVSGHDYGPTLEAIYETFPAAREQVNLDV